MQVQRATLIFFKYNDELVISFMFITFAKQIGDTRLIVYKKFAVFERLSMCISCCSNHEQARVHSRPRARRSLLCQYVPLNCSCTKLNII